MAEPEPTGIHIKRFGALLREILERERMSEAELAAKVGSERILIAGWLRGQAAPSELTLQQLQDLFPDRAFHLAYSWQAYLAPQLAREVETMRAKLLPGRSPPLARAAAAAGSRGYEIAPLWLDALGAETEERLYDALTRLRELVPSDEALVEVLAGEVQKLQRLVKRMRAEGSRASSPVDTLVARPAEAAGSDPLSDSTAPAATPATSERTLPEALDRLAVLEAESEGGLEEDETRADAPRPPKPTVGEITQRIAAMQKAGEGSQRIVIAQTLSPEAARKQAKKAGPAGESQRMPAAKPQKAGDASQPVALTGKALLDAIAARRKPPEGGPPPASAKPESGSGSGA